MASLTWERSFWTTHPVLSSTTTVGAGKSAEPALPLSGCWTHTNCDAGNWQFVTLEGARGSWTTVVIDWLVVLGKDTFTVSCWGPVGLAPVGHEVPGGDCSDVKE